MVNLNDLIIKVEEDKSKYYTDDELDLILEALIYYKDIY